MTHLPSRHATSLLPLMLLLLAACGEREGDSSNANGWSLDDARDQGGDLTDMSSPVDLATSTEEMTPEVRDQGTPDLSPSRDMSPPEDMAPDLTPSPDMAPPRRCERMDHARITLPSVVRGTLPRGRGPLSEYPCERIAYGQEQHYLLVIDAPVDVDIWTTYQETTFSPTLVLQQSCEAGEEITACSGFGVARSGDYNGRIVTHLEPGDYVLTVDERVGGGFTRGEGGDYVLHVDQVTLDLHATCETARPLGPLQIDAPPVSLYEENALEGDTGDAQSCFASGERLKYYSVALPAGYSVSVEASYTEDVRPIFLKADTSCQLGADSLCDHYIYAQRELTISNTTTQPQTYYVAAHVGEGLPYVIQARYDALQANATCEEALVLTAEQWSPPQPWSQAGAHEQRCNGDFRRQLYYSVEVPDAHRLQMYGSVVEARASCDPMQACFDERYINRSGQPQQVILAAPHAPEYDGSQAASVMARLTPLATHSICQSPLLLQPGQTLTGQDILGGSEFFTGPCNIIEEGYTLYYEVQLPLGLSEQVRVRAMADDPQNRSLSLQVMLRADAPGGCEQGGCEAVDNSYFSGDPGAEVVIRPTFGGGRDPIRALVVVTMAPGHEATAPTTFTLETITEPLMP